MSRFFPEINTKARLIRSTRFRILRSNLEALNIEAKKFLSRFWFIHLCRQRKAWSDTRSGWATGNNRSIWPSSRSIAYMVFKWSFWLASESEYGKMKTQLAIFRIKTKKLRHLKDFQQWLYANTILEISLGNRAKSARQSMCLYFDRFQAERISLYFLPSQPLKWVTKLQNE